VFKPENDDHFYQLQTVLKGTTYLLRLATDTCTTNLPTCPLGGGDEVIHPTHVEQESPYTSVSCDAIHQIGFSPTRPLVICYFVKNESKQKAILPTIWY